MKLLKNGSRGDDVTVLQGKLNQLGFGLDADGIFGDGTHKAIVDVQSMFGYTVDGLVGEGTMKLIDAQVGYGWNVTAPDAQEKALRAQGKDPAQHMKAAGGKDASAPIKKDGAKPIGNGPDPDVQAAIAAKKAAAAKKG
ncbi:MAG: peptidoglycan hydrolase-like protein with peptidoglycan-binding domain [Polyangiales bacterium]|jgi:peptidoglycan hydrolase-like protein with peptidoglycan-binding domain